MGAAVSFDLRGMPECQAMLAGYYGGKLQNRMRRAVRAGANEFKPGIVAEAISHHGGSENVPISFRRVKVKVSTHGGASNRDIVARVKPQSALFNIFEPGAEPHTIAPRGVRLMAGAAGHGGGARWDEVGRKRKGAFFARGAVRHPGMKARPILPAAFSGRVSAAKVDVARVIFEPHR